MATYTIDWVNVITSDVEVVGDSLSASGGALFVIKDGNYVYATDQALVQSVVSSTIGDYNSGTYTYTMDRTAGANLVVESNLADFIMQTDFFVLIQDSSNNHAICATRWSNLVSLVRTGA